MSSIVVSLIAGWILILAITSVIPTNPAVYTATAANTAAPVAIWESGALAPRRRAAPAHRRHRPGLLRHGLGDGELPHALRLQPGRRRARAQVLAPHQPAHEDADELDLVLRRLRLHPGRPVAVERRGLRRGDVDRHHRPLHRLRAADPAATPAGEELARRALVARASGARSWAGSGSSGWPSSPSSSCSPRWPSRASTGTTSTTPHRGRGGPGVLRRLLVAQRPQVVHRAEGAGRRGRAQARSRRGSSNIERASWPKSTETPARSWAAPWPMAHRFSRVARGMGRAGCARRKRGR